MSTPSQPDDHGSHTGAAASWPNVPQHDRQSSAPQGADPQAAAQQVSSQPPAQHWPGHNAAQQPASAQQAPSAPPVPVYSAPQSPGNSSGAQHPYSQPQYGTPAQRSATAPGQEQHDTAAQQYPAPAQQYAGAAPQQYGSAPQQYVAAQQYGSAPQQYGAADASGRAPAPAADPVKKRATVGIILGASTIVLSLLLYILQTILLRVLLQSGSYEAYGAVSAAISWLSVIAMGTLGVIALILGLSAAKSGLHPVRSGIAIGVGALATAGSVITLIEFLLNWALTAF